MIKTVDINSIRNDPEQPRKIFDDKHIKGLAQSLATEGIINPIEVDSNNQIITGECRWRAAKLLGWKEVKININPSTLSKYERLRRQMAENVHQSGSSKDTMMNPIDTAKGYATLYKMKTGKDFRAGRKLYHDPSGAVKEIAKEIGISVDTVYDFLNLLEEPKYVIEDLIQGRPRTYYREAENYNLDKSVKKAVKKKIAKGGFSSRDQVKETMQLLRKEPEATDIILARKQAHESKKANKVLTNVATLVLAIEDLPVEEIDIREVGIIRKQLEWLQAKIDEYLTLLQ